MEAIALIFSKFSEELISAQLALLFFTLALAVYWLLVRKKKRESAEWVPAALVRAYLDRMQADERATRLKLFGEVSPATTYAPLTTALAGATDPNFLKELEALRTQLALSDQRAMEYDRTMNAIRAEKTALEQKLKDAMASAGTVVAGAPVENPAATKELEDLRARLQEYEVIEDDLANLKKFQKENEQLRQKIDGYEKGGTPVATISASPSTGEAKMIVSGGAEKPAPAMTLVSGGATAAAAPAPVASAPEVAVNPGPVAPETNTNVLAPVTPTLDSAPAIGAAAPAAEKSTQQKEDELLSEFEKMLAS